MVNKGFLDILMSILSDEKSDLSLKLSAMTIVINTYCSDSLPAGYKEQIPSQMCIAFNTFGIVDKEVKQSAYRAWEKIIITKLDRLFVNNIIDSLLNSALPVGSEGDLGQWFDTDFLIFWFIC